MDSRNVSEFFDRLAPTWDENLVRDEEKIRIILDNANLRPGARVLDVACGTGVLIPDYLARGAASVTGVDLSPEMLRAARAKFPQENVRFVCGDAVTADAGRDFDVIVVYNAFPHFPDPEALIARLSALLSPGGTLTVAHGASREEIDRHHVREAGGVAVPLMGPEALRALFGRYLTVTAVICDDRMYQVAGVRA